MIIQITRTRNERFLIEEMLPIWKKYADGFVFLDDRSTDGTTEFLFANKNKYNIISILHNNITDNDLSIETNERQALYDEALKYSNKIICMDSDEYLDGNMTKQELEDLLDKNLDTTFNLDWIQYTSKNQIRVDGPWRVNTKDRIGSYSRRAIFQFAQMHSTHLPYTEKNIYIKTPDLFIAHLQWLDKQAVAIKQYFWKVTDYVNRLKFNVPTLPPQAYDESVANFNWEYKDFNFSLKIDENIYKRQSAEDNYKLRFIKDNTLKYNIPNLNDWNMGIYQYISDKKNELKEEISICIVTFKEREEYVKELIEKVRKNSGENFDILLAINGNNEEDFDEEYRKRMLTFCSGIPRCFPILCTEFKSLPKLWNTLIIFSKTNYNFIICDDVEYGNQDPLKLVKDHIQDTKEQFFTINGGFSFFVITKDMLHKLNYFDERLCGYGEEDGDIVHSFILNENRNLPILKIIDMNNKALYNIKNKHTDNHIDNKPRFNREFVNIKYKSDPSGICGMNHYPLKRGIEDKQQYPYELFVKYNKYNIRKFDRIIMKYE